MKVDPESPPVQGLTTFLAFVVLNLLYLLTCLPVVTIGVATSAQEHRPLPVVQCRPGPGSPRRHRQ